MHFRGKEDSKFRTTRKLVVHMEQLHVYNINAPYEKFGILFGNLTAFIGAKRFHESYYKKHKSFPKGLLVIPSNLS